MKTLSLYMPITNGSYVLFSSSKGCLDVKNASAFVSWQPNLSTHLNTFKQLYRVKNIILVLALCGYKYRSENVKTSKLTP